MLLCYDFICLLNLLLLKDNTWSVIRRSFHIDLTKQEKSLSKGDLQLFVSAEGII